MLNKSELKFFYLSFQNPLKSSLRADFKHFHLKVNVTLKCLYIETFDNFFIG